MTLVDVEGDFIGKSRSVGIWSPERSLRGGRVRMSFQDRIKVQG